MAQVRKCFILQSRNGMTTGSQMTWYAKDWIENQQLEDLMIEY